MAYADVAGLPLVFGLWAISGPLLVYAVLGSSRHSVGPESTTALMTASVVAPLAVGDPGRNAVLAAALGLIVGGLFVIGWLARLGFLADLLSKPVLVIPEGAGVCQPGVVDRFGLVPG
jgi:sulfate permease, SulP family